MDGEKSPDFILFPRRIPANEHLFPHTHTQVSRPRGMVADGWRRFPPCVPNVIRKIPSSEHVPVSELFFGSGLFLPEAILSSTIRRGDPNGFGHE
jgi:hypothetical protein